MEGATPSFLPLVRHRGGLAVSLHSSRPTSPFRVAPSTVIPGGKASRRAFALLEGECLLRVALQPLCRFMCCCMSLCCAVYRFITVSLPKPVKVSSASASSGTSTSAPGCAPSSMKPSKNRRPQMARDREGQGWRMLTTRNLRSEPRGSLPPRSTVSDEESRGLQHRKTCPPTS